MTDQGAWHDDLRQKLESFYDSDADRQDLDALGRFLAITPDRAAPSIILPIEEMEERLQLAAKLEKHWKDSFSRLTLKDSREWKPFSTHQIAALMIVDLDDLRVYSRNPIFTYGILAGLCQIPSLTKIFLTKPQSHDDLWPLDLTPFTQTPSKKRRLSESSDRSFESDGTQFDQRGNAKRNTKQADKRLSLDENSCIILKTADPEVCHIVPFSANAKEDKRQALIRCFTGSVNPILFKGGDGFEQNEQVHKLFTSRLGVSDRKWNLISLDRQLHEWWGSFYFGLKCLGTALVAGKPDGIATLKLQFHWMPRREQPSKPLARTKQEFLDMFKGTYGDPSSGNPVVAAARPVSGRPIRTGDIFYVDIQTRHVHKMMLAFEIQWALVRIAAMTGGAEALELVGDEPDYLDESGQFLGLMAEFRANWDLFKDDISEYGSKSDEPLVKDAEDDGGKGKGKMVDPSGDELDGDKQGDDAT
ncbi:hypothetical protein QBC46DRAFT_20748 [Diplogelasinospora grovesii]|uniref:HNH nuclease domain-containing protein n=1 Tax=Diplogelasinospora grovesii TaxID=303347 RepID=A0AAN6S1D6_9PEZI|nr:hypothetical protein QBC46DRAFT_20748 [Diplogelasinospora grovesii]